MRLSKDLLLKNNFNSTIVKLANICQIEFPDNYSLVMAEFDRHMKLRLIIKTTCLENHRQEHLPKHITRHIFKEVRKYLTD